MIRRLIQFKKPSYGVFLGLICFAVSLNFIIPGRAELRGLAITPGVWGLGLLFGREKRFRRISRFEAALPIRGRDVYCAKIMEETLGGCIALLALLATILFTHGAPAGITIAVSSEVGTLLALGRIAEHAFQPAEVTTPKWWGRIVGGFVELGSIAIAAQIPTSSRGTWVYVPIAGTICFVASCVVGSIVLFWSTWSSFPDALQLAPAAAVDEQNREKRSWLPSFAWRPLLPALFGVGSLISSLVLLGCGIFGLELPAAQIVAIAACWSAIWGKFSIVGARDRWIFALPFSRQKMFLTVIGLPLGVLVLGSVLHFSDAPQATLAALRGLVVVSTAALLPGLFVGIPSFARGYRVPWAYVRLTAVFAMMGVVIWAIGVGLKLTSVSNETWLMTVLPAHSPFLIAAAVAIVGTAYWLGVSGFRRMETRPPRMLLSR
jgi:hypothetical protein